MLHHRLSSWPSLPNARMLPLQSPWIQTVPLNILIRVDLPFAPPEVASNPDYFYPRLPLLKIFFASAFLSVTIDIWAKSHYRELFFPSRSVRTRNFFSWVGTKNSFSLLASNMLSMVLTVQYYNSLVLCEAKGINDSFLTILSSHCLWRDTSPN